MSLRCCNTKIALTGPENRTKVHLSFHIQLFVPLEPVPAINGQKCKVKQVPLRVHKLQNSANTFSKGRANSGLTGPQETHLSSPLELQRVEAEPVQLPADTQHSWFSTWMDPVRKNVQLFSSAAFGSLQKIQGETPATNWTN